MLNKFTITAIVLSVGLACHAYPMTIDLGGLNNSVNTNNYVNKKLNEYTDISKSSETTKAEPVRYNFQKGDVDVNEEQSEETSTGGSLNSSKTIYTDNLGRIHFFGKGSVVKE